MLIYYGAVSSDRYLIHATESGFKIFSSCVGIRNEGRMKKTGPATAEDINKPRAQDLGILRDCPHSPISDDIAYRAVLLTLLCD
jgi:hypothetical protein